MRKVHGDVTVKSEIAAAEERIVHLLREAYAGNPVKAVDVMRHVSFTHPATVVHAAFWSMIRDGKLVRERDHVMLAHV